MPYIMAYAHALKSLSTWFVAFNNNTLLKAAFTYSSKTTLLCSEMGLLKFVYLLKGRLPAMGRVPPLPPYLQSKPKLQCVTHGTAFNTS